MEDHNMEELLNDYNQEQSSDEDPEVEVRGKKYKASQIEEFERGYLRQSDATKKWQEASEIRKNVEAQLAEYNTLKNQLGYLIQKDPSLVQYAQALLSGQNPKAPYNSAYDDDPYMREINSTKQQLQQSVQQLWQYQQNIAAQVHEQELEKEIASAKAKYPFMDEDKVLSQVAAQPNSDIEELAKLSHDEMNVKANQILKAKADNRKNQMRSLVEGSGGRTSGMGKPAASPKTRAELDAAISERLRMLKNM